MNRSAPLIKGKLLKRYKRFLADIALESGEVVTAHCANSGSMAGLITPGYAVMVSHSDDPNRKLKYTLELINPGSGWVGIHTGLTNHLAHEAIANGAIAELAGYTTIRREVKYGRNSRIDLLLEASDKPACYVEVKNVTLKRAEAAEFPDSVTERGAKHMLELRDMTRQGFRTVVLFIAQREDADCFRIARDIDPAYDAAFREALDAGVEALCYRCQVGADAVTVEKKIPIIL